MTCARQTVLLFVATGLIFGGCTKIDLSQYPKDLVHHVVAMNGDGEPLDPDDNLDEFGTDEEFDAYLNQIAEGLRARIESSDKPVEVLLFFHGALNTKRGALETARKYYGTACQEGFYPIFFNWDASIPSAYGDHLFRIRQGRRNAWLGIPTSPLYLAVDLLNAVAKLPLTWAFQIKNRFVAEFPRTGTFKELARERHEDAAARMERGEPAHFRVSPYRGADGPRLSWRTPGHFLVSAVKAPLQLALSPLVASGGTSAWTNYLRRTTAAIHRPSQFRDSAATGQPEWATTEPQGALAVLMRRLEALGEELGHDKLFFTVIGHSTGAILVNRLIEAFPDVRYRSIVYLAAAATVDDFRATVLPHLEEDSEATFYSVSLDTYSEAREGFSIIPSGSLLEWLDVYFTRPPSDTARVFGKWENTMAILPIIPREVRDRVYLTKLPFGESGYPQQHGDVNEVLEKFAFWSEKSWRGEPEARGDQVRRSCSEPTLSAPDEPPSWWKRPEALSALVSFGAFLLCALLSVRWARRLGETDVKKWFVLGFLFNALTLAVLAYRRFRAAGGPAKLRRLLRFRD